MNAPHFPLLDLFQGERARRAGAELTFTTCDGSVIVFSYLPSDDYLKGRYTLSLSEYFSTCRPSPWWCQTPQSSLDLAKICLHGILAHVHRNQRNPPQNSTCVLGCA